MAAGYPSLKCDVIGDECLTNDDFLLGLVDFGFQHMERENFVTWYFA